WLTGEVVPHPPLYWEFHERGFFQAARIDDWKAVRIGATAGLELYDLRNDLAEPRNVAAEHPEVVRRFEDYVKTARVDSELWPVMMTNLPPRQRGPQQGPPGG